MLNQGRVVGTNLNLPTPSVAALWRLRQRRQFGFNGFGSHITKTELLNHILTVQTLVVKKGGLKVGGEGGFLYSFTNDDHENVDGLIVIVFFCKCVCAWLSSIYRYDMI